MNTKKMIKVIAIVMGALFVVCIGVGIWTVNVAKKVFHDPHSAFETPTSHLNSLSDEDSETNTPREVTIATEEGDEVTYVPEEKLVNILVLGIDSTAEREAQHYGYRSDVMILCTFDMANNRLNMLTFPRDLYVDIYQMDTKTGEITGTTQNRINTAYGKGGGPKKFGAQNSMLTVEKLIADKAGVNVDVDYFVSLDIDALPKIADAIGGVEVVLDTNVGGLGKKGDTITVTSKNIDTYMRDRHTSGSDSARTDRQQKYLIEVAKKMQREGAIKSATAVYQKIASDIRTNLTLDQITALAGFVQGFDMDNTTRYTVEASDMRTESGAAVLKLNEEVFRAYILDYFFKTK